MVNTTLVSVLKYGGTFVAGLLAGGFMVQRAFKKALMQNYQQMMGQMDPQAMAALSQQLGGAVPGAGGNLNVVSPTTTINPNNNVIPPVNVVRGQIQPLNLTASSLGGGSLKV